MRAARVRRAGPPSPGGPARPSDKAPAVPGAGALGMAIFLVSLSVLFTAAIVAALIVRLRAGASVPPVHPSLGLWASTVLILAGSGSIHAALRSIRRGDQARLLGWLTATFVLAIAFLVSQALNWRLLLASQVGPDQSLQAFAFYTLTGLHALHVLGGAGQLGTVLWNARAGRYTWAHYPGVRYAAMYVHFLNVVWLALMAVLLLDLDQA